MFRLRRPRTGSQVIEPVRFPAGYEPPSALPRSNSAADPSSPAAGLTEAEDHAIRLAAQLWNVLATEIIARGPSRETDLCEMAAHIHGIQHAVMAQAAARGYPDRYRLLGGTVHCSAETASQPNA